MLGRTRVATFNANSIRSRLDVIIEWINANDCDVLCVQETKVQDVDFPVAAIHSAGLHCVYHGQKSYNGVAIISRKELTNVMRGLGIEELDKEARIICASYDGITIVNTYVPQGTAVGSERFEYKLAWIRAARTAFERDFTPETLMVWVGDFNVARLPIDVYDPEGFTGSVCYHPDEHAALDFVAEWGLVDVFRRHHPDEPNHYSFWDYRIPNGFKRRMGWRLDHIWATRPLANLSLDCRIDPEPRSRQKSSDHTFVVADFEVE